MGSAMSGRACNDRYGRLGAQGLRARNCTTAQREKQSTGLDRAGQGRVALNRIRCLVRAEWLVSRHISMNMDMDMHHGGGDADGDGRGGIPGDGKGCGR